MMMSVSQRIAENGQRCCVMTIMHNDVHVADDGHRCCVMTIMQDDVCVTENDLRCCVMTIMQDVSMLQRMITDTV